MEVNAAIFRPGGLDLTRRLIEFSNFFPGCKVVDIGCGTGVTVEYLRNFFGVCAIGVDISEQRIRQGNDRISGSPLLKAAGEELPLANATMDGALAECSLSVMQNAAKVLAECSRVLLPGGRLGLSDLYVRSAGCASGVGRTAGIMSYSELAKLLKNSGFKLLLWEDHSVALKVHVASYIMQFGAGGQLWQGIAPRLPKPLPRPSQLGYFLLVAEKQAY